MSLEARIRKRLGPFLLDVDFAGGSGLAILGASGCGKSMTLKCIAGVETPDSGRIVVNGRTLFDSEAGINLPPQERRVGYLFQNYALFPRMTVGQNVRVGMRAPRRDRAALFGRLAERFRLEGLEDRYPHQLSGGQQQRVALCRMLAAEPETLLLDEPFSALDAYLRERLQVLLRELLRGYDDVIMVTHNRDEAYALCPEMLVLDGGRVLARGATRDVFANPGHVRAARLTGCKNISAARKVAENAVHAVDWDIRLVAARPVSDGVTHVGVRAHDFVAVPASAADENVVRMLVRQTAEDPFERVVVFGNADASPGTGEASMWWKYSKYADLGEVRALRVPPERVLLLEGGPGMDEP